jgi:hypothetical protein
MIGDGIILPFGDETDYTPVKLCIECKKIKNLSEFRKDKKSIHPVCLKCDRNIKKILREIKKTAPPRPDHCECCGRKASDTPLGTLVLDHDHKTKKFRGWICDRCNLGIGKLGDNIEGLQKGIKYLELVERREKEVIVNIFHEFGQNES